MLIKIRYPNYVSVLISFVFCSWIINEFEILRSNTEKGVWKTDYSLKHFVLTMREKSARCAQAT